jgi:hypothetical protein
MNAIVQSQHDLPGTPGQGSQQGHSRSKTRQLLYVLLSLVPSVTLMFGWTQYRDMEPWSGVPVAGAIGIAVALWLAELVVVPVLVKLTHVIFGTPDPRAAHYDVDFLEAFAPPVLMLTPLLLVVSRLFVYGVAAAFLAVAMMLFVGRYAGSDSKSPVAPGSSWLVVELGFIGWGTSALLMTLV